MLVSGWLQIKHQLSKLTLNKTLREIIAIQQENYIEIDKSQLEKFDNQDYSSRPAVGAVSIGSTAAVTEISSTAAIAAIAPTPLLEIPAKINLTPLIMIGSIAIGAGAEAGIGTFFGGIGAVAGAIGGAIFGLISGVVSEAFMSSDHRATIKWSCGEINITSCRNIIIII